MRSTGQTSRRTKGHQLSSSTSSLSDAGESTHVGTAANGCHPVKVAGHAEPLDYVVESSENEVERLIRTAPLVSARVRQSS